MSGAAKEVSVIIVNYNCDVYIKKCIRSVYEQTKSVSFEIIVVDNASADGSVAGIREEFPDVIIIENEKNVGFGAANNTGAASANGKYLLLLNPDTILINDAPGMFYRHATAAAPGTGCYGGNLLDEHMQPANLGGNFPSLFQLFSDIGFRALYPAYYKKRVSLLQTADTLPGNRRVDCVCGADLFIDREIFNQVKGFDEDYFLYFEDTDMCYRLKKAGYINEILPEVKILHLESAVIADNRGEKMNLRKFAFFEQSKQLFFRKSYGPLSLVAVKFLTVFYILARWAAHRGNARQYFKMIEISLKIKTNKT